MLMNVRTRAISGTCAQWDGGNPQDIRDIAGDRLLGLWAQYAVVLANDGVTRIWVAPGWLVIRSGELLYFNSEGFPAEGAHPLWEVTD